MQKNKGTFTKTTAKVCGRMGGIQKGIKNKNYKTLKESLTDRIENNPDIINKILDSLIAESTKGNIKAIDLFRDILGEKDSYEYKETSNVIYVTKQEIIDAQTHIKSIIDESNV